MLYNTFRFFILVASFMGVIHMFDKKSYEYIIFPVSIIVGVSFSFFDPLDKEYIQRNGKGSPSSWSWFQNEEYDYPRANNNGVPTVKNNTYTYPSNKSVTDTSTNSFFFNKSKVEWRDKVMKHYNVKKRIIKI